MDYLRVDEKEEVAEKAILHLYKNNLYTDGVVKYKPGDVIFHVHKLILSFYSPVLSAKFYGKNRTENDVLNVEGYSLIAVQNMIRYFYGEPLVFESIFDIKETKRIAERYELMGLIYTCVKEIYEVAVDKSNVLMVLEMSMEYGNKEREKECLEIMSQNRETVFASELFMKMKFGSVCQIFEKLRERGFLTEVQYLRSALGWMACNGSADKGKLLGKIEFPRLSKDDFIDIVIGFPDFFTSIEISNAFEKIKSVQEESKKNLEGSEDSTESDSGNEDKSVDVPSDEQKTNISNQEKKLTISIFGEDDAKEAILTIVEESAKRSLRFKISGDLNQGILASLSKENGDHTFDDVYISYEGLYCMMNFLRNEEIHLSSVNCIEILKVAIFFNLLKLQDVFLLKVANITDYDPEFLDRLRYLSFLDERLKKLLTLKPKNFILHPNFINCSAELLRTFLALPDLGPCSEVQLLLVTITWLEARNRQRWEEFRFLLLNEISFENISYSDLEYVNTRYPEFFADNEINSLLLYKGETGDVDHRGSLPDWYNFKRRVVNTLEDPKTPKETAEPTRPRSPEVKMMKTPKEAAPKKAGKK